MGIGLRFKRGVEHQYRQRMWALGHGNASRIAISTPGASQESFFERMMDY
jgi:hypothetical protein